VGVAEEHAVFGEFVKVRGANDFIDASRLIARSVGGSIAAPVVGEEEEDVGSVGAFRETESGEE
jgi:hypothetical protein